jgi:hypothetical protein
MSHDAPVQYAGISFSPDKVEEKDRHHTIASVALTEARSIRLTHSPRPHHPLLLLLFGLALGSLAFLHLASFLRWLNQGGNIGTAQVWLFFSGLFGLWAV